MLEKLLIKHCAPTLAGIKTGNLFNCYINTSEELLLQLQDANKKLSSKGIQLEVLRIKNLNALILAYRPKSLVRDLGKKGVDIFLKRFGYEKIDIEYAISKLKERFAAQSDFPHEIGLFLGYPFADVIGFIENAGQNSKCVGCWKVYCDEREAIKLFDRYKKCKDVYSKMFAGGCSIMQLIVAA